MKGPYDREGEGPLTKLWLPKLKERMRDRTHFAEASVVEGSKQIKDVDKKEKDELMQVCQTSVGGHDSSFIRGVSSNTPAIADVAPVKAKTEEEEIDEKPGKKSKKGASVADERPKKYGKLRKDMGEIIQLWIFFIYHFCVLCDSVFVIC